MKTTLVLLCICLSATVALACNNKSAGDEGYVIGEVVSVAEMDSASNKTRIEVKVSRSDFSNAGNITILMEGGWHVPAAYRGRDIHTQIRYAVPTFISEMEKGDRTYLVVVGQTIVATFTRQADGSLLIDELGTLFVPPDDMPVGQDNLRQSLEAVRAALASKDAGAIDGLRVYANPPNSIWSGSMAFPDAKIRTGDADAEWTDFWPYLVQVDKRPVSVDSFLADN
jgi:hypothetical protein